MHICVQNRPSEAPADTFHRLHHPGLDGHAKPLQRWAKGFSTRCPPIAAGKLAFQAALEIRGRKMMWMHRFSG